MIRAPASSAVVRWALLPLALMTVGGCGGHLQEAPQAVSQSVILPANTTIQAQLQVQHIDAGSASYRLVQLPTHGTVSLNATSGSFLYTAAVGYTGTDAFSWAVGDKDGQSGVATVGIQVVAAVVLRVGPVGDAPRLAAR